MKIATLFVGGILGLALAVSCDGSSSTAGGGTGGSGRGGSGGNGGNGGTGGNGGAGCQAMNYHFPGCNASPTCDNGSGGTCSNLPACGCDGKVISGCEAYPEPFAYRFPLSSIDASDLFGSTCDPSADAGH